MKHKIPAIPCASNEAMAVPPTPVWNTKTNIKSKAIFNMLQTAKKIIGHFASPNEHNILNGI